MKVVDRHSVAATPWGDGCLAWPLVAGKDLSVKLEVMPAGTREHRHRHRAARQVFFVLQGVLEMELDGRILELRAEQSVEVPPGVPHQAHNRSGAEVRFLVVSSPTTAGDREAVP